MDGAGLVSAKDDKRRLEALERENAALRRVNAKLMRERLGSSNTAAAGSLAQNRPGPGRTVFTAVRSPLAGMRLWTRRLLLRLLR